jgi:hypothetical protein
MTGVFPRDALPVCKRLSVILRLEALSVYCPAIDADMAVPSPPTFISTLLYLTSTTELFSVVIDTPLGAVIVQLLKYQGIVMGDCLDTEDNTASKNIENTDGPLFLRPAPGGGLVTTCSIEVSTTNTFASVAEMTDEVSGPRTTVFTNDNWVDGPAVRAAVVAVAPAERGGSYASIVIPIILIAVSTDGDLVAPLVRIL